MFKNSQNIFLCFVKSDQRFVEITHTEAVFSSRKDRFCEKKEWFSAISFQYKKRILLGVFSGNLFFDWIFTIIDSILQVFFDAS